VSLQARYDRSSLLRMRSRLLELRAGAVRQLDAPEPEPEPERMIEANSSRD